MRAKKLKTQQAITITLSLNSASLEFGVTREILRKALTEAAARGDIAEAKPDKYTIRDCFIALSSDARTERAKLVRVKRETAEFDLAIKRQEYLNTEVTRQFIIDNFSPLRDRVVSLPGQLAAQVNPSDPEHARAHLNRWVDDFLAIKPVLPKATTA